jgi:hypothetical protein
MKRSQSRATSIVSTAALLLAGAFSLRAGTDNRAPEVPARLVVEEGNKVQFHVYAVGVQIYVWTINPTTDLGSWIFKAPEAVLLDSDGNPVGTHYAGPTWESESGSKVVGQRVDGVTVDSTAIPWLLLKRVSSQGPGIFANTTFIQRVHTVGGLTPATPGGAAGEEGRVSYLAEYFFYRAE